MNDKIIQYLIIKRSFIFLDEWLSYFILYNLWSSSYYSLFSVSVVLAILFNGYAYKCYWEIEDKYNDYLIKQIDKLEYKKIIDKKITDKEIIDEKITDEKGPGGGITLNL